MSTEKWGVGARRRWGRCRECQERLAEFHNGSARLQGWAVAAREFAAPVLSRERTRRGLWPVVWGFAATWGILIVVAICLPRFNRATNYARHMAAVEQSRKFRPGLNDSNSVMDLAAPQNHDGSERVSAAPMIAHTARIALVTKDVTAAERAIEEILKRYRGYIARMNANAPAGSTKLLECSLRVPDADLDGALAEIRRLGRVESETRAGEDVTRQSMDLNARLANAHNREQRLSELLRQRTGRLSDVLEVETQVDSTRGEIERMEAEWKSLSSRVTFASVDVQVAEEHKAALGDGHDSRAARIRNAAMDGLSSVAETLFSMLTFVLSSGPSLLLWGGIIGLVLRGLWRRFGNFGLSYWKDDERAGVPETRR